MKIGNSTEFGAAIRRQRRARGLSQESVALSAGVGLRFVHDLEHGKETVELGRALRVAAVVGLRVEAGG
jgi:y4mF family transcriptional regulator